ncbi:MAG: TetR/AcrR family transcriptional regulator [Ilumatobacteraceae bacterium]
MRKGTDDRLDGRRERSRRTRRAIVVAATDLFVSDGYGSTTITAIADRAGVSVQTVYASFGTKRAILAEALDQAIAGDDEVIVVNAREWMREVWEAPTGVERLAAYAAAVRRIVTNAGDLYNVVTTAASTDPEVVALASTAEVRRRAGAASVVGSVTEVAALRRGLTTDEAIDVLWTLNSPAVYHLLVRRAGWDLDRYERWLAEAFVRELLEAER